MSWIRLIFFTTTLVLSTFAQDFRATLTGQVIDPTGAVVVDATVRALHIDTNATSETRTNESGRYSIPFLTPGKFQVTVEATGFKKVVRENVELQINSRTALNVTLEVGNVADSVTVSTEMSLLETETASRGGTVDNRLLQTVPNAGRNINQLAFAMPGVYKPSKSQGNAFTLDDLANSRPSISGSAAGTGGSENNNDILIDGTSDATGGRGVIMIPALESVQEFRVLTNIYDAQYGRTGGGIVSSTTKSGTNEFHGAVFNRRYDNRLNANTFANNRNRVERPDLIQNNYGFQTNGPIFIPKLFDGRNKLFYMLSYDSYPQSSQYSAVFSVPLPEMKGGDFSNLFANDSKRVLIYDPLTTKLNPTGGSYSRTPFAGNVIPQSRLNTVGRNLASFYPDPNQEGNGPGHVNNYYTVSPNSRSLWQWMGRLDYRLSDRNIFFGRYGETDMNRCCDRSFPDNSPAETSTILPRGRRGRTMTIDWSSVLSPTMTFNLRAGFSRLENVFGNSQTTDFKPEQLGWPSSLVSQFARAQFPVVTAGSYKDMGAQPSNTADDTYTLGATFGKVSGTHVMKYGVELREYRSTNLAFGAASGTYAFTKLWTQNNPNQADAYSGNEIASMLLGNPASGSVTIPITPAYQGRYYALFLQDDWKLTPKLTLNLGLRWDYETPVSERYNRQVRGFAFDQASPIASAAKTADGVENCAACGNLMGGLLYAGSDGSDRFAFNPDRNNIQIRLGAAYALNAKTTLRGGFGIFSLGQWALGGSNGFSRTTQMVTSVDGLSPSGSMSLPFSDVLPPVGSSLGLATDLGIGTSFNYLDRHLPMSKQYSFGVQREVGLGIVVDASYVGNSTTSLPVSANMNFIPESQLGQAASFYTTRITNPLRGLLPNNATLNGATIQRQLLLVAYPQYSGLTVNNLPAGTNRYDALQVSASKRFSSGITFQANYMKAKTLEGLTLLNAQDLNLSDLESSPLERRLSIFDVPQKLSLLGSYELPIGKGRHFFNAMHPVVNGFLGNWTIGWNATMQSGFPIDFPNAAPIAARSAKLPSGERTLERWFDTSVFPTAAQASFTLRNFPTRFPDVRFMGVHNYDFSLQKEIPIKERVRIQVRADMINSMNRPYFTNLVSANVTNASFGQINPAQSNEPRTIFIETRLTF